MPREDEEFYVLAVGGPLDGTLVRVLKIHNEIPVVYNYACRSTLDVQIQTLGDLEPKPLMSLHAYTLRDRPAQARGLKLPRLLYVHTSVQKGTLVWRAFMSTMKLYAEEALRK
jgi:hypothetical protein